MWATARQQHQYHHNTKESPHGPQLNTNNTPPIYMSYLSLIQPSETASAPPHPPTHREPSHVSEWVSRYSHASSPGQIYSWQAQASEAAKDVACACSSLMAWSTWARARA